MELSQFCADSDWENEQRNPGEHLNHTLNFNHLLKTFQALQKSVKERRQLILLISTTPRKVKPHNLELKLGVVQDPRCPMDTYKSQAEHLVLGSLRQAITDPFQSIRLQKESELGDQVVLLSSDPMKILQSCVSSCKGQTVLQQHPYFSMHFYPFHFLSSFLQCTSWELPDQWNIVFSSTNTWEYFL